MKQMKAPNDIRILATARYGTIESGFARIRDNVFFLLEHGRATFMHPVLEDGTILIHGYIESPDYMVNLICPKELGISEIRWANPEVRLSR
jgi:hypothetical protein